MNKTKKLSAILLSFASALMLVLGVAFGYPEAAYAAAEPSGTDGTAYICQLSEAENPDKAQKFTTIQAAINMLKDQTDGLYAYEVELLKDWTESIVIPEGLTVTLNVGGTTLTNEAGKHTIENYGTLTIISESNGTIDNVSHGKASIVNYGTATLSGGKYTRSQEKGASKSDNGGNSFYVLHNQGTMTIGANVNVIEANGKYSSLIANGWQDGTKNTAGTPATLTINGGRFSGGLNTVKNDDYGVMNINGGTFENMVQFVVLNWNALTITNGTFNMSDTAQAVVATGYINGTYDQGKTTIEGGEFNGALTFMSGFSDGVAYEVSGGTFTVAPAREFLANGCDYIVNEAGIATVKTETEVASEAKVYIDGVAYSYAKPTTDCVAQIGEKNYYTTLAGAIAAAQTGETVKLVADLTIEAPIEIAAEADLTLDFNGFTATYNGNGSGTRPFQIYGNLTVNNGAANVCEEGKGGVTVTDRLCWGVFDQRGGTFIVNGGYFRSCGYDSGSLLRVREGAVETTVNNGSFVVAGFDQKAYDGAFYNDGSGKVTINDGYFYTTSDNTGKDTTGAGNWYYCVQSKNGTFIVNGGTIIGCQGALAVAGGNAEINNVIAETRENLASGQTGRSFYALYVAGAERKVNCVVNGGTFTSAYRAAAYVGNSTPGDGGICADALVTIKDGTFTTKGTGSPALSVDGAVGTASVEGGIFNTLPAEKHLAQGHLFMSENGTFKALTYEAAAEQGGVAVTGGVAYTALADAITNAAANGTVTLLANVTLTSKLTINKSMTLDLNGYTITHAGDKLVVNNATAEVVITSSAATAGKIVQTATSGSMTSLWVYAAKSVTVHNITVDSGDWGIYLAGTSALTVTKSTVEKSSIGILVFGTGKVTVTESKIVGENAAIQGNGNYDSTDITLTNCMLTSDGAAIYHPQDGKLTVDGGTIMGATGIEIRAGELTVTGGAKITATAEYEAKPNGSGATVLGAAIAVSQHTTNKEINITIESATLTGKKALVQVDLQEVASPTEVKMTVTGGTFSGAVETARCGDFISGGTFSELPKYDYFKEGYSAEYDEAKQAYVTKQEPWVAVVGEKGYLSLQDAVAVAEADGTVTLLNNATLEESLDITKNITLDLNGKTLTLTGTNAIYVSGESTVFTVQTSTADGSGKISAPDDYAIMARQGGTVVVNSGTIEAKYSALSSNNTDGVGNFTVNGGTLTALYGPAIYMPAYGELNVTNGTINGGALIRMGNVNITGGTFIAPTQNIDKITEYYNYSGNAWLGGALTFLTGAYTFDGNPTSLTANVTGGTFTNDYSATDGYTYASNAITVFVTGNKQQDISVKVADTGVTYNVTEGCETFVTYNVAGIVGEGYKYDTVTNVPTINEKQPVATDGLKYYDTLPAAVAGAPAGATVTMLADDTVTGTAILIDKNLTLDLNGKTITLNDSSANLTVSGGDVTVTSTAGDKGTITRVGAVGTASANRSLIYCSADRSAPVVTKLTLKNINLNTSGDYGLYVSNTKDVAVENCNITAVNGVYIQYATGEVTIDQTTIGQNDAATNPIQQGVYIRSVAGNTTITDTTIYTEVAGIKVGTNPGNTIITGTTIYTKGYGIVVGKTTGTVTIGTDEKGVVINGTASDSWGILLGDHSSSSITNTTAAVNVTNTTINNVLNGIVDEGKHTLTVNGSTINATGSGITGLGTKHGTDIIVAGTTINAAVGIYQPQDGKLVVNGGTTITATVTGIEMRSGNLTVDGATIESKATTYSVAANGSGSTVTGAAIAISQHGTNLPINVTITDATLKGPMALVQVDTTKVPADGRATVELKIEGGMFEGEVKTGLLSEKDAEGNTLEAADARELTGFISNGTFSKMPDYSYLAEHCIAEKQADGSYSVNSGDYVAEVGENRYTKLATAIANAQAGDTVVLLCDDPELYSSRNQILIDKSLTLDLNGYTLKNNSNGIKVNASGADVTIKNGKVVTGDVNQPQPLIVVTNVSNLLIQNVEITAKSQFRGIVIEEGCSGTVTVKDSTISNARVGILNLGTGTLTVDGGSITSTGKTSMGVSGNGNAHGTTTVLNNVNISTAVGVYQPQNGKLTVNGGTITGTATGIEIRAGELTVTGEAKITSTATEEEYAVAPNSSGTTVIGAAIAVSQHTTNKPITVTIEDNATLTGYKSLVQVDLETIENRSEVAMSITGGTFEGAVESERVTGFIQGGIFDALPNYTYFKEGYSAKANTEGKYITENTPWVATIGTVGYQSLQEAVTVATASETVTLLCDHTLTYRLVLDHAVTLDLGGHRLTTSSTCTSVTSAIFVRTANAPDTEINVKNGRIIFVQENNYGIVVNRAILNMSDVEIDGSSSAYGLQVGAGTVSSANLNNVMVSAKICAVALFSYSYLEGNSSSSATLTATGCHFTATEGYAVAGNGQDENTDITLNNCTLKAALAGIFHPQDGKLTVNGGSIEGVNTGIEIRAGELTVTGGAKITATATEYSVTPNSSGSTVIGAAIAVSQHTTNQKISVSIDNATLTGKKALVQVDLQEIASPTEVKITVTGGTFSGAIESERCEGFISGGAFSELPNYTYFANGYSAEYNATDKVYETVPKSWVAVVGEKGYLSLQAAIDEASTTETTITLLGNAKENITIAENQTIILDLSTFKLENATANHTVINNGTLTIQGNGTVDNTSHKCGAVVNYGKVTLVNGTYTRSAEAGNSAESSGNNSWYVLFNQGTMTIQSNVTVTSTSKYSSLIENGWYDGSKNTEKVNATLTINGGMFDGGINTVKNDDYGVMTIKNGTFTNVAQFVVLNWNELTIENGTFNVNDGAKAAVATGYLNADYDKGTTTIQGGTFNSGLTFMNGNPEGVTYSVKGGAYTVATLEELNLNKLMIEDDYVAYITATVARAGGFTVTINTVTNALAKKDSIELVAGKSAQSFTAQGFKIYKDYIEAKIDGVYVIIDSAQYAELAEAALNEYREELLGRYEYSDGGKLDLEEICKVGLETIETYISNSEFVKIDGALTTYKRAMDDVLTKVSYEKKLADTKKEYLIDLQAHATTNSVSMAEETVAAAVEALNAEVQLSNLIDKKQDALDAIDAVKGGSEDLAAFENKKAAAIEEIQALAAEKNVVASADLIQEIEKATDMTELTAAVTAATDAINALAEKLAGTQIEVLTPGVISGSTVVFDGVVLRKTLAPVSTEKDYWVGIKVTAPAYIDGTTVENAKYYINGETKAFNANKDGEYFIQLWGRVSADFVAKALELGANLEYTWSFDWNNDGLMDDVITIRVIAKTVVLFDDCIEAAVAEVQAYAAEKNATVEATFIDAIEAADTMQKLEEAVANAKVDIDSKAADAELAAAVAQAKRDASEYVKLYAAVKNVAYTEEINAIINDESIATLEGVATAKANAIAKIDEAAKTSNDELAQAKKAAITEILGAAGTGEDAVVVPTATLAAINAAVDLEQVEAFKTNALKEIEDIRAFRKQIKDLSANGTEVLDAIKTFQNALLGDGTNAGKLAETAAELKAYLDTIQGNINDHTSSELSEAKNELNEAIDNAVTTLEDAIADLADTMTENINGILDTIDGIVEDFGIALDEANENILFELGVIEDALTTLDENLDNDYSKIFDMLVDAQSGIDQANGMLESIADTVDNIVSDILESEAFQNLATKDDVTKVQDAVKALSDALLTEETGAIAKLQKALSDAIANVQTKADEIAGTLGDMGIEVTDIKTAVEAIKPTDLSEVTTKIDELQKALEAKIGGVQKTANSIATALTAMGTDVTEIKDKVNAVKPTDFSAVTNQITALQKALEAKITEVKTRADGIAAVLATTGADVTAIMAKVNAIKDTDLPEVSKQIDEVQKALEAKIDEVKTTADGIATALATMGTDVTEIKTKVNAIKDTDLPAVSKQITDLQKALEAKIAEVKTTTDGITTALATMGANVTEIKKAVNAIQPTDLSAVSKQIADVQKAVETAIANAIADFNGKIGTLTDEIGTFTGKLNQVNGDLTDEIGKLEAQIKKLGTVSTDDLATKITETKTTLDAIAEKVQVGVDVEAEKAKAINSIKQVLSDLLGSDAAEGKVAKSLAAMASDGSASSNNGLTDAQRDKLNAKYGSKLAALIEQYYNDAMEDVANATTVAEAQAAANNFKRNVDTAKMIDSMAVDNSGVYVMLVIAIVLSASAVALVVVLLIKKRQGTGSSDSGV